MNVAWRGQPLGGEQLAHLLLLWPLLSLPAARLLCRKSQREVWLPWGDGVARVWPMVSVGVADGSLQHRQQGTGWAVLQSSAECSADLVPPAAILWPAMQGLEECLVSVQGPGAVQGDCHPTRLMLTLQLWC